MNPSASRSNGLSLSFESLGGSLLITLACNGLLTSLGLVTGILAARLLGPQGRGELAAIQTWPTNLAYLGMLGVADATVYFTARDPGQAGKYITSATTLILLLAIPTGGLAYFAMPVLLAAQSMQVIHAARGYVLLIPLMALVTAPFGALRGKKDFLAWNMLRPVMNLGWLLVLIAGYWLGGVTPGWLAVRYLAVMAMALIPTIIVTRRRISGPFAPDYRFWRPMLAYGVPTAMGSVSQMFNLRLDQMLMAAFLPPRELGLYVAAVAWSGAAAPLTNAIGMVAFPRVAGQPLASARAETVGQAFRLGGVATAGFCALLFVLAPWGVRLLFGAPFSPAIPAALILTVAAAFLGLNTILEESVRGLGDTKAVLWSELAGLAVTLPALAVLLPRMGIAGAALASLLAYSTVTACLLLRVGHKTGNRVAVLLWPRAQDFWLARDRLLGIVRG